MFSSILPYATMFISGIAGVDCLQSFWHWISQRLATLVNLANSFWRQWRHRARWRQARTRSKIAEQSHGWLWNVTTCEDPTKNFHVCNCSSKHVQKPEYRRIDGEVTQCSWQTLWLHAEYRVYSSHATVYTELVWPLLSSLSFFLSFHLTQVPLGSVILFEGRFTHYDLKDW